MKKLLISVTMALVSSVAIADTGPGCGVGSMVFKGQQGVGPHVLAATTNGTLWNQTIGMTFGALGCNVNETIQVASIYMDENAEKVARDISRGEGEYLSTLAVMFGVKAEDRQHFYTTLQGNFSRLFPDESIQSGAAFEAILAVMQADPALAGYAS